MDAARTVVADLHMHSTRSDGEQCPSTLVRRAAEQGLRGLSLTDHDTLDGIPEAREEAASRGIDVLSGVELSATLNDTEVHLLAYGIDVRHAGLRRHLDAMHEARWHRAQDILTRLQQHGLDIPGDALNSYAGGSTAVGRPHVARVLVKAGCVSTIQEAFNQYLEEGRPGFVPKPAVPAARMVDLIHKAGGMSVLAHPGDWTSSRQVRQLAQVGLDGIEVYHPSHRPSLIQYYRRLAKSYDLVRTGGSDYHGRTEGEEQHFCTVGLSGDEWERFRAAVA